jgi:hypothetical protein
MHDGAGGFGHSSILLSGPWLLSIRSIKRRLIFFVPWHVIDARIIKCDGAMEAAAVIDETLTFIVTERALEPSRTQTA